MLPRLCWNIEVDKEILLRGRVIRIRYQSVQCYASNNKTRRRGKNQRWHPILPILHHVVEYSYYPSFHLIPRNTSFHAKLLAVWHLCCCSACRNSPIVLHYFVISTKGVLYKIYCYVTHFRCSPQSYKAKS